MTVSGRPVAWQQRAACRGLPTEMFIGHGTGELAKGLAVCRTCSVVDECRAWGEQQSTYGALVVIGGRIVGATDRLHRSHGRRA